MARYAVCTLTLHFPSFNLTFTFTTCFIVYYNANSTYRKLLLYVTVGIEK